jgi:Arm DNA-binding domain
MILGFRWMLSDAAGRSIWRKECPPHRRFRPFHAVPLTACFPVDFSIVLFQPVSFHVTKAHAKCGSESGSVKLGGTSARVRNKLTARAVAALSKPGRYSDGGGLYLRIDQRPDGRRCSWVFRFQWRRATREMGLGSYPQISLAEARKAMHAAASAAWDGQEPIAARVAVREAAAGKPTFGDAARALMAAKQSEWRNAKHRWQWRTTLET